MVIYGKQVMVNEKECNSDVTIFYYSGTGNSLYVARKISDNFKSSKLLFIPKLKNRVIECSSSVVGFVFPVNGKMIPPIVFDFIDKLKLTNPSYIFGIETYGMFSGKAKYMLNQLIMKKGYKLDYFRKIKMPANCVISYRISTKNDRRLSKAERVISRTCEDIKIKKKVKINNLFLNKDYYSLIDEKSQKYLDRGKLFYSTSTCTKCGICSKICPVNNIEITKDGVSFLNKCVLCMACINWCPSRSINWNGKTEKRSRYINPNIKYTDFIK